jgi:hypothetical protein
VAAAAIVMASWMNQDDRYSGALMKQDENATSSRGF